ncbi:MAG: DUF3387 domain-containing protein [bacterium]|nr:DUF3387 domain-containing protein [bacterium]
MGNVYILALIITLISTTADPGTRPIATGRGLASSPPLQERAISHGPILQAPATPSQPDRVTSIHAETQQQRDTAEWALDAMTAAGFDLPPVTIYMHTDRHDCSNEPGGESSGYFTQYLGENIIHSCGSPWVLIHELAHVWDKTRLDGATRELILEHQELDSWNHEIWNQAGGEHLASIIAWAIEGTHPSSIGYYDRNHLAEAYRLATGRDVPGKSAHKANTRIDLTDEVDALVEEALDLFSAAGLDLPEIDIIGFDSIDECFGRSGAAIHSDRRTEIHLCVDGTGIADDWVVIHELAHAWDHNTLDSTTRQAFLDLRGLDSWRDGEWHERGAEHAAEIIVWGLIDRSVKPGRINQNSCSELLTGYETLTGGAPLHGHTDACD